MNSTILMPETSDALLINSNDMGLVYPKQQETLSGELINDQNIDDLVDNIIENPTNHENNDQSYHDYDQEEDEDDSMVMFRCSFTNVLDNYNRACIFDAMLAYSVRTASETHSNNTIQIRPIADVNSIFQPGEQFSIIFNNHGSYLAFLAWLTRTYAGYHHVLTIVEPAAFAMKVTV